MNLASQYISFKILPGHVFLARYLQKFCNKSIIGLLGWILQGIHFLQKSYKILQKSAKIMHHFARRCNDLVRFARILQEMEFFSRRVLKSLKNLVLFRDTSFNCFLFLKPFFTKAGKPKICQL